MFSTTPAADHEREAALDVLLLLADIRAGWHEYDRALDLLEDVETAVGELPEEYELRRRSWLVRADRAYRW